MSLDIKTIKEKFPNTKLNKIQNIINNQDKFGFTLENLKCLNPNCKNMVKIIDWEKQGPSLCCSSTCSKLMKNEINIIRNQKIKKTYNEKTGYNNAAQNPDSQNKKKKTMLDKYGVENIFQKKEYIDEARSIKTGFKHPSYNPEILKQKKLNNITKWGTTHHSNKHIKNLEFSNDLEFWQNNFITDDGYLDFKKAMDFFNCSDNTIRKWFYSFNTKLKVLSRTSYLEQDVRNHLLKYFNKEELVYNTKKIITPKELDIYIPTLNLAIEINGLFWHSFNNDSKKNYHINQSDYDFIKFRHQFKTLECLKKGIRLLHIYEGDDYINKIDNFINWVYEPKDIYELDSGCYPIVNKFYISEPVEIKVLNNRLLWKAGFMKINKGEQ